MEQVAGGNSCRAWNYDLHERIPDRLTRIDRKHVLLEKGVCDVPTDSISLAIAASQQD
jgi:hypothetical protein